MGLGLPAAAAHALDAAGRRIGALFPCRIVVWEAEPGFQHVYHLNTMLLARETGLAPDTETWSAVDTGTGDEDRSAGGGFRNE